MHMINGVSKLEIIVISGNTRRNLRRGSRSLDVRIDEVVVVVALIRHNLSVLLLIIR